MAGISKIVNGDLFLKYQLLLKQQGKSGEVSCKLQAIISARNNSVSEVAKIFGITRATLRPLHKSKKSSKNDFSSTC